MSFSGKIVLVTGASRGIGAAIADEFIKNNATVIGTATTEKGVAAINERFKDHGFGHILDVRSAESVDQLMNKIMETCGKHPDILINNAGITRDNLILRMKQEEWDDVLNTNLSGAYRLIRACIKSMVKARWGRIVTIGSVIGSRGNAGQMNYAAAKAGLVGMTKALALELGSRGITANVVAPGFVETEMTATLKPEQVEQLIGQLPIPRLAKPHDIAVAVRFLASDEASYITGETLHVNGGMYMA
jgi:3-oxoacyl-[acyl-carrier protein] reductase